MWCDLIHLEGWRVCCLYKRNTNTSHKRLPYLATTRQTNEHTSQAIRLHSIDSSLWHRPHTHVRTRSMTSKEKKNNNIHNDTYHREKSVIVAPQKTNKQRTLSCSVRESILYDVTKILMSLWYYMWTKRLLGFFRW
jgi:hypothetical protein